MPGWHDAIKDLYESGELQVVGIIQEQHPHRCQLFMQWKQMDWPILVDSLNLLRVAAVPITVAIDEHGIVRATGLRLDKAAEFREGFMKTAFPAPAQDAAPLEMPEAWPAASPPAGNADAKAWQDYASHLIRAGSATAADDAVAAYQQALSLDPQDGWSQFRLGVAMRMRYDSPHRRPGDFQAAVDHWKAALDIDPNQYIWRRRIQQYGPRLDKPYPFYDWVPLAREEIAARGEQPAPLVVEPGGAEFASPTKELSSAGEAVPEPDAEGRIHRDTGEFVVLETVAAPASLLPGEATRVHVVMRPQTENKAHWNNEAEGVELWLAEPEGCSVDNSYRRLDNPPDAVSLEERRAEFELRCAESAAAGRRTAAGHALYYVCEDIHGVCLYRRQDFSLSLELREP